MATLFQIRRGSGSVSLVDGEIYLHKGSGSLQVAMGTNPITLARLNDVNSGSLYLAGDLSASNAYFSGDVAISGNLFLGNSSGDNISVPGVFTTNLVPGANGTLDLGTNGAKWKTIYANTVSASSFSGNVDGVDVTLLNQRVTSLETESSSLETRAIQIGIVTGSLISTASANTILIGYATSSIIHLEERAATIGIVTSSLETRAIEIGIVTGSLISTASSHETRFGEIATITGSLITTASSHETRFISVENVTSSLITTASNHEHRLNSIQSYTSSLKTAIELTGSNVTILGNLDVKGTQTIVDSTTIQLGDNIIELNGSSNTNGGLLVKDPTGGTTISGSLLWDTTNDYWKGGQLGNESKILLAGGDNVISSSLQLNDLNQTNTALNQTTASLNLFSASVTASLVSIYQTTASLNTYTTSVNSDLSSIHQTTASLNIFSASVNGYTASMNIWTSSIVSYVANQNANSILAGPTTTVTTYASYDGSTLTGWTTGSLGTTQTASISIDSATGSLAPSFKISTEFDGNQYMYRNFGQDFKNKTIEFDFRPGNAMNAHILIGVDSNGQNGIGLNFQLNLGNVTTQNGFASVTYWSGAAGGDDTYQFIPNTWYSIKIIIGDGSAGSISWYVNNALVGNNGSRTLGNNTYIGLLNGNMTPHCHFDNLVIRENGTTTPVFRTLVESDIPTSFAESASAHAASLSILNTETASLETRATQIGIVTGSLISSASSFETRFATLATETGSLESRFATLGQVTASVLLFTSSLNTYTGATEIRLDDLEYTASISVGAGLAAEFTKINAFTASTNTRLDALELYSASYAQYFTYSGSQFHIDFNV